MTEITCQMCGLKFEAARRSRMYCKDCLRKRANAAHVRYKKAHKKGRQVTVGACEVCGCTIYKKSPVKKYCDACAVVQKNLKSRECNQRKAAALREAAAEQGPAAVKVKKKKAPPPKAKPKKAPPAKQLKPPKPPERLCVWCDQPLKPGPDKRTRMHAECRTEYQAWLLHEKALAKQTPAVMPPKLSIDDIVKIMNLVYQRHGITMQYGEISKYTEEEKLELLNGKRPWK